MSASKARARLLADPSSADFEASVALLESESSGQVGADTLGEEALRFHADHTLGFSSSEVADVQLTQAGQVQVRSRVLSLSGADGPLPLQMRAELAREDDESAVQNGFVDLITHRFTGLLFRGLRKHHVPGRVAAGDTRWLGATLSILGFDPETISKLKFVRVEELLSIAPWLLAFPRGAQTLAVAVEKLMADELGGAKISVRQFQGEWSQLASSQFVQLGTRNSRLGVDLIAGDEIPHVAGKLELSVGPLDEAGMSAFARDERVRGRLSELLLLLLDRPVDISLSLHGAESASQPAKLGESCLGEDAWLGRAAKAAPVNLDFPIFAEPGGSDE